MSMKELGNFICERRIKIFGAKGQHLLAKACQVSTGTICTIEQGNREFVKPSTLHVLAKNLKVPLSRLAVLAYDMRVHDLKHSKNRYKSLTESCQLKDIESVTPFYMKVDSLEVDFIMKLESDDYFPEFKNNEYLIISKSKKLEQGSVVLIRDEQNNLDLKQVHRKSGTSEKYLISLHRSKNSEPMFRGQIKYDDQLGRVLGKYSDISGG